MTERYSWTVNLMQINLMQTNHTDITAEISGKEGNCSDRGSIALSCERV